MSGAPQPQELELACSCGTTTIKTGFPRFRMYCHCSICQRFNDAEMADVAVLRKTDLLCDVPTTIDFDTYRPPPNVQRGVCKACRQPVLEVFDLPVFPSLVMLPQAMHQLPLASLNSSGHLFYENRRNDHHDDLPKHHGYIRSQWGFMRELIRNW